MSESRLENKVTVIAVLLVAFVVVLSFFATLLLGLKLRPTTTNKLAELYLSGGIIGYCHHLIVYDDGSAFVSDSCRKKQVTFQVEANSFNQIYSFATEFGPYEYKHDDGPRVADGLSTRLILYGRGSPNKKLNQQEQGNFSQTMQSILNQARFDNPK